MKTTMAFPHFKKEIIKLKQRTGQPKREKKNHSKDNSNNKSLELPQLFLKKQIILPRTSKMHTSIQQGFIC